VTTLPAGTETVGHVRLVDQALPAGRVLFEQTHRTLTALGRFGGAYWRR